MSKTFKEAGFIAGDIILYSSTDTKPKFLEPFQLKECAGEAKLVVRRMCDLSPEARASIIEVWASGGIIEEFKGADWVEKENLKLISPYGYYRVKPTKPSIDWSQIGDEFNYMVVNTFGNPVFFSAKPKLSGEQWFKTKGNGAGFVVNKAVLKCFKAGTVDWKDSLIERNT